MSRIDVVWVPGELEQVELEGRVAVVIDALRAASTMATALHNGAHAIVPAVSIEEAKSIAQSMSPDPLLCGERGGLPIKGFDLGNSPGEYGPEIVRDRTLVMTTTNGTRALRAVAGRAEIMLTAAFVNAEAVAKRLVEIGMDTVIVCAGRGGRVSLDDVVCAGTLVQRHLERGGDAPDLVNLNDGAQAAAALARAEGPVSPEFLARTAAGSALLQLGFGDDLELCARTDTIHVAPVYRDGWVTLDETDARLRAVGD